MAAGAGRGRDCAADNPVRAHDRRVGLGVFGAVLRPTNFARAVSWSENVAAVGVPGQYFHDLRHTGTTLAAGTGASLRELMTRMGHSSPRAALIYQHATSQRDRVIADALDVLIKERALPPPAEGSGT